MLPTSTSVVDRSPKTPLAPEFSARVVLSKSISVGSLPLSLSMIVKSKDLVVAAASPLKTAPSRFLILIVKVSSSSVKASPLIVNP